MLIDLRRLWGFTMFGSGSLYVNFIWAPFPLKHVDYFDNHRGVLCDNIHEQARSMARNPETLAALWESAPDLYDRGITRLRELAPVVPPMVAVHYGATGLALALIEEAMRRTRQGRTFRPVAVVMARYLDSYITLWKRDEESRRNGPLPVTDENPVMCLAWMVRAGYEIGRIGGDSAVTDRLFQRQ